MIKKAILVSSLFLLVFSCKTQKEIRSYEKLNKQILNYRYVNTLNLKIANDPINLKVTPFLDAYLIGFNEDRRAFKKYLSADRSRKYDSIDNTLEKFSLKINRSKKNNFDYIVFFTSCSKNRDTIEAKVFQYDKQMNDHYRSYCSFNYSRDFLFILKNGKIDKVLFLNTHYD